MRLWTLAEAAPAQVHSFLVVGAAATGSTCVRVCCSVCCAEPVIWRASGFKGAHCREVGTQHPPLGILKPSPHFPWSVSFSMAGPLHRYQPLPLVPNWLPAHSVSPPDLEASMVSLSPLGSGK